MAKVKRIIDGIVVEVDEPTMVKVIENGVVVEKPASEVQSLQTSPEKKSPIGSSTQGLQGLGGSSGGNLPSPLSASATPPETPFIGAGRLESIKESTEPKPAPKKGLVVPNEPISGLGGITQSKEGDWEETKLSPQEEQQFRDFMTNDPNVVAWAEEFKRNYGEYPSIEGGGYDYRGAFKSGQKPVPVETENGTEYHWGSIGEMGKELKSPDHPTRWKSDYMQLTGKNPDEEGISEARGVAAVRAANLVNNVIEKALNPPADPGTYFIDGKQVPKGKARQYIDDRSFSQAWLDGNHTVDIQGDDDFKYYAEKQKQSLTDPDWYDSIIAGIFDVKKNAIGLASWANDITSELTGIPNFMEVMATASTQRNQVGTLKENLAKSFEEIDFIEDNLFKVNGEITDLISDENWGEAGRMMVNTALRSSPNSIVMAGAGAVAGTGLLASAALTSPLFMGGAYADQEKEVEDINKLGLKSNIENLSKFNRMVTRPVLYGGAEAAGQAIEVGIFKSSGKIMVGALGSLVKKTAATVGTEAAKNVAQEGAAQIWKNLAISAGINPLLEATSEVGTYTMQELTDIALGVSNKTPERIVNEAVNTFILGWGAGQTMSSPATAATVVSAANQARKKLLDYTIAFDPKGVDDLNAAAQQYAQRTGQSEEIIKENIAKRAKAVNAVPKDMVEDTEAVDLVEEKQTKKEQAKGLDPIFAAPIEEEIADINAKLSKKVRKEYPAPTVNTTPTEKRYASVNRNDGKGDVDLTQEEYLAEMERRGTPVEIPAEVTPTETVEQAEEVAPAEVAVEGVRGEVLLKENNDVEVEGRKAFDIFHKGKQVGTLSLEDKGTHYEVSNAKVSTPSKGIGTEAYKQLISTLDKPLMSDKVLSQGADALWRKLEREGLAKYNEKTKQFETVKTVAKPTTDAVQEQAEEVAPTEETTYPKKYASSRKRAEKDGTEYRELDAKDIDLERSGIEIDENEISSIILLEDQGPNQEGINVGTVWMVTKNGADTFEVFFSKPTSPTEPVKKVETEVVSESELNKPKTIKELESENKATAPKVKTDKVFLNASTPLNREETKGVDKVIKDEAESSLPIESISVEQIVPTQKNLTIPNLEKTKGVTDSNEEILLVEKDGKFYVIDGHHRIANRILDGDKAIEARVFREPVQEPAIGNTEGRSREEMLTEYSEPEAAQSTDTPVGNTEGVAEAVIPKEKALSLSERINAAKRSVEKKSPIGDILSRAQAYNRMGKRMRQGGIGNQLFGEMASIAKENGWTVTLQKTGSVRVLDENGKEVRATPVFKTQEEKKESGQAKRDAERRKFEVTNAEPQTVEHWVAMALARGTRFSKKAITSILGSRADIPAWMWSDKGVSLEFLAENMRNDGFGMDTEAEVNQDDVIEAIRKYATKSGRQEAFDFAQEQLDKMQGKAPIGMEGATEAEWVEREQWMETNRYDPSKEDANEMLRIDELSEDDAAVILAEMEKQGEYESSEQFTKDLQKYANQNGKASTTKTDVKQAETRDDVSESETERTDLAKRIRDKKIGGISFVDPLFGAIGISKALYDGALELAARQVEKGTKLGTAIANAIKYIDERMSGKKWDKGLFGRHLNDQFKMTVGGKEVEVKRDLSEETLEVVNGWYSPLEKSIKEAKADSLTAKEWLDKVRSKEGEDLWTGLRGMLEAKNPKERVSKRELLAYLKDNRVDVVEVVKDSDSITPNKVTEDGDFDYSDQTKFSQYQLEGEKENYKEVLVTLPSKANETRVQELIQKKRDRTITEAEEKEFNELDKQVAKNFQSSHFDEPNILVHLRMNTRKDVDGNKVLFLEEVQSDWGQQGKRVGFKDVQKQEILKNAAVSHRAVQRGFGMWADATTQQKKDELKRIQKQLSDNKISEQEFLRYVEEAGDFTTYPSSGVPQAPFVTDTNSWVKLGVKVALKEAVAQGVDKIAWTTGEQQNERYSLDKSVSSIGYDKKKDGTYSVLVKDLNGKSILEKASMTISEIEQTLGKDIAQKIQGGKDSTDKPSDQWEKAAWEEGGVVSSGTITGEGLKVEGKGMKGFYGSPKENSKGILGSVVESITGQKVGKTRIEAGDYSIGEGNYVDGVGVYDSKGDMVAEFDSKKEADEYIDKQGSPSQPSITITPEIVSAVKSGLPLFGSQSEILAKRILDMKVKGLTFVDPTFGLIGITTTVYNAALDIAAKEVMKSNSNLGKAIKAAIEYIDSVMAGKKWDKKLFESSVRDPLLFVENPEIFNDLKDEAMVYVKQSKSTPTVKGLADYFEKNGVIGLELAQVISVFDAVKDSAPKREAPKPTSKEDVAKARKEEREKEASKLEQAKKEATEKAAKVKESAKESKAKAVSAAIEKAKQKYVNIGARIGEAFGKAEGEVVGMEKGLKQAAQMQKWFAKQVNTLLEDMISEAKEISPDFTVTPKQLKAITKKLLAVNPFSKSSFANAVEYMEKVLEDAAYLDKMDKVRDMQKAVRKRKHPAFQSAVNQFLSIRPEQLPDELVEPYMEALEDMNRPVPSYRKMQDMFFDVTQHLPSKRKPFKAIEEIDAVEKLFNRILEREAEATTVEDYLKLLKDIRKWRAMAERVIALESDQGVIDEMEQFVEDIDAIQERFEKKYADEIADMKAIRIDHILDRMKELDPFKNPSGYNDLNLSEEAKTVLKELADLGRQGMEQLTFEEVTTLGDVLDLVQQDGYTDLSRLVPIVAKATARLSAPEIAKQVMAAPELKDVKGMQADLARSDMSFREGLMGFGRRKYGAFHTRVIAPMLRAASEHLNFINSGRKFFNDKKKEYKLKEENLDRIGMFMFYLREHALSFDPKYQDKTDAKGGKYGFRDWFSQILENNKEDYGITATDEVKRKAGTQLLGRKNKYYRMKDAFDSFPKDKDGKVDVQAAYEAFKDGSTTFLSKNEMDFLKDVIKWDNENTLGKQRAANEMRDKQFDEIMFHIHRKRTPKLKATEVEAPQVVLTGKNRVKVASDSGQAVTSEKIEPIEFNFEELFDTNLNETSRDYFYTPALMRFNATLKEVKKLLPEKKQKLMDIAAWDMQESLNHDLSYSNINPIVKNILKAQAMSTFIDPIRTAIEMLSSFTSYPFRARISPIRAAKSMRVSNDMVKDLLRFTSSPLMNKESLQKHFEVEKGTIKEKGKLEKLTYAMAGAPELVLLKPIWYGRFYEEFFNRTGKKFNPSKFTDPEYRQEHRQEIMDSAAAADGEYTKISGSPTGLGGKRKARIAPRMIAKAFQQKSGDIDVKTNMGMLTTFMTGYTSRDFQQIGESAKSMLETYRASDGKKMDYIWALGIPFGSIVGGFVYAYLNQVRYVTERLLAPSDDEEEDEARKELETLTTLNGAAAEVASSFTALAATRYHGLGRQFIKAFGSIWFNMAESEEEKAYVKSIVRNVTYQNPYNMEGHGNSKANMALSLAEAIPLASIIINNASNVLRQWKDVDPIFEKISNGEPLTEPERDKALLIKFTIAMGNATAQFSGYNFPSRSVNRSIDKYVSEFATLDKADKEIQDKKKSFVEDTLADIDKTYKGEFIKSTKTGQSTSTLKEAGVSASSIAEKHNVKVFKEKYKDEKELLKAFVSKNGTGESFTDPKDLAKNYFEISKEAISEDHKEIIKEALVHRDGKEYISDFEDAFDEYLRHLKTQPK